MAIAKITLNGVTQMDVTGKTVTSGSMLSGTTALKNDGTDITGNIASKSSSDLTASGATVTAPAGYYGSAASKTIPDATYWIDVWDDGFWTDEGVRKWKLKPFAEVDVSEGDTPGYFGEGRHYGNDKNWTAVPANTTITPSTSAQTVGGTEYMMEGPLTVAAMPTGSATTPATTITANPSISVNSSTGVITATTSKTQSVTPTVSAGYVSSGTSGTITVSGSNTSSLSTQAATTITPTKQSQTAVAAGKYTTGAVTVAAIPAAYQDVTSVTATAADVRYGKVFVNSSGTAVTGTLSIVGTARLGTGTIGFE